MNVVLALGAFVLMEPAAALLHRTVMHGRRGWAWHASHHRPGPSALERNDRFPVVFALATIALMAVGSSVDGLSALVPIGCGITAYGATYLLVHDGYVHERLGRLPGARCRYVQWVRTAHAVHHRTGRAPYGFLVPVVGRRSPTRGSDGLSWHPSGSCDRSSRQPSPVKTAAAARSGIVAKPSEKPA